MNAGNYPARIQDWGIKFFADKNEYKLFVKFELVNPPSDRERYITWNGSLDETPRLSKAGKDYTMLDITLSNLKTLGYRFGSDLEAIVTEPNPFELGETFDLDVASFVSKDGKSILYVRSFQSQVRPKEERQSSSVKQLEKEEAKSYLSGLMSRKGLQKKAPAPISTEDIPF
jgi:hypothetical protein